MIATLCDAHGNLRAPESVLAEIPEEATIVIGGDAFERTIAGRRVVDSGSVGSPFEDEPGACWMLDLQHRRTDYEGAEPPSMGREEAVAYFEQFAVGA